MLNAFVPRSSQCFVRRRRHDVRVIERRRNDASSDQPGNMRHVCEQPRADAVADLAEALVVEQTRVGARARDDHVWTEQLRLVSQLVVVDRASLRLENTR